METSNNTKNVKHILIWKLIKNDHKKIKKYIDLCDKNEIFYYVIKYGNYKYIKYLIESGIDMKNQSKALRYAIKNNDLETVKYIINGGYENIGENNNHFLNMAIENYFLTPSFEIINFLIEKGFKLLHETKFMNIAFNDDNFELFKILINNGCNINCDNGFFLVMSIDMRRIEWIHFLLNNGINITDLIIRSLSNNINSKNSNFEIAKIFFEKGFDINHNNGELLKNSVFHKNTNAFKFLVENGADIHIDNEKILYISLLINPNIEIIKFLFENGADIYARNGYMISLIEGIENDEIKNYIKSIIH